MVATSKCASIESARRALGLTLADVQQVVALAIGGENVGETVEGLQRFPINIRYPRELRDSVDKLSVLPIVTEAGATTTLGAVADLVVTDGPPQIRSENARLNGWVYVDISGRDLGRYVRQAQKLVAERVALPPGYSIAWSGQFEYLERATKKLTLVVPVTLAIIFVLLYLTFRSVAEAALIMVTLPFALVGGLWLLFALGYNLSIASAIGFIALAGVSAEFGVVMLIYLDHAIAKRRTANHFNTEGDLIEAIEEGAVLRVRPKAMTVTVIIAGLLPIMFGGGTGSEVMRRIAAPMVGGMITAPMLSSCRPFRLAVPKYPLLSSVSTSRSSNRTCGLPASGSRTNVTAFAHDWLRPRAVRRTRLKYPYRCESG